MTASIGTWLLALWMLATAVGIVIFWLAWFRTAHDEPWLPTGYVEHERVFVYPDTVLAILLATTATLTLADNPGAKDLGLVAAGMMAFLAIIDLAYFIQHGMFARNRDGLVNVFLVASLLALSIALIVMPLS